MRRCRNAITLLKFLFQNLSAFKQFLIGSGLSAAFAFVTFKFVKKLGRLLAAINTNKNVVVRNEKKAKNSPQVNAAFFQELKFLAKTMFPKLISKQTGLLAMHSVTLFCRTFLSVYVAQLDGSLVKSIVQRDFSKFVKNLIQWLLIALPATTCNSLIKFVESNLELELKSVLVSKSLKHYFDNRIYYKISLNENIQIDQSLTDDIETLCHLLVHLYSQLTKPILDITVITFTLIMLAKENNFNYFIPTVIGFGIITATGLLMRQISPKFGKMVAEEAKRKGYLRYLTPPTKLNQVKINSVDFRFLYSRVQANSEEIAFYSGEQVEKTLILKHFDLLKKQSEYIYKHKLWYVIIEQFLMKYVWSAGNFKKSFKLPSI